MQGCFSMWKSSNVIYHINRMTRKRNDHLSNCRKAFDCICHIVMIITLKKPRTEEKFFILIKNIYTTKTNKQKKNLLLTPYLIVKYRIPFYQDGWEGRQKYLLLICIQIESPFGCKEIKPIIPKGNQLWIFIGRTDCWSWSSNTLATWLKEPTYWKRSWCWKRLKAKEKRAAEDEMVR